MNKSFIETYKSNPSESWTLRSRPNLKYCLRPTNRKVNLTKINDLFKCPICYSFKRGGRMVPWSFSLRKFTLKAIERKEELKKPLDEREFKTPPRFKQIAICMVCFFHKYDALSPVMNQTKLTLDQIRRDRDFKLEAANLDSLIQ